MTQQIIKDLGGLEDLALGTGVDNQTRGDTVVPITRINTDWIFSTSAELTSQDTSRVLHAMVINGANVRLEYDYLSSSTMNPDGLTVLAPDVGLGRWILRNSIKGRTKLAFAELDTSPDISSSEFWATDPTAVTITGFAGGVDGQVIYITAVNGNTTLQHTEANSGLNLKGKSNLTLAVREGITFIRQGANWWTEV